jgi:acetyl esterase
LQDDNRALATRLAQAGIAHELAICEGLPHGFIRYGALVDRARRAVSECARAIAKALG